MSISVTTVEVTYDGNAVASQYSYTFRIDNESAVEVYVSGVQQTLGVEYTVSGVGETNGGTISFVASLVPASGTGNVKIFRNSDPVHAIDYSEGGALPVANAEASWDRLAMVLQEHRDWIDNRVVKIPRTHTASSWNGSLSDPGALSGSAPKVLGFRSSGIVLFDASLSSTVDPLTTQGQILVYDTAPAALDVGSTGGVLHVTASSNSLIAWGSGATSFGQVAFWTGSTMSWGSMGSIVSMTAKGDMLAFGSAISIVSVGSNYQVLGADSSVSVGVKYMDFQPYGGVYGCRCDYGISVADQASIFAKLVILRNPTTGEVIFHEPAAAVTLDVDETQGASTANQRDQSAAFTSAQTIHIYYIWNGSTLATIASLGGGADDPFAGPTLPSGYTHWAYVGSTIADGSGEFVAHHQRGNHFHRISGVALLSGGTATSFTAVNYASYVPQSATNIHMTVQELDVNPDGSGQGQFSIAISIDGSNTICQNNSYTDGLGAGSSHSGCPGSTFVLPNYDAGSPTQQFWYKMTNTLGTGAAATLVLTGYQVPNGDC